MEDMTELQKQVLLFVFEREEARKSAPSLQQICARFRWSSTSAARCHLLALEKKGYIHREFYESRSIEILAKARDWYASRHGMGVPA